MHWSSTTLKGIHRLRHGFLEARRASVAALCLLATACHLQAGQTSVSISGDEFQINGQPTYAGRFWQGFKVQGLLMNARLVQGIFDDANPATRARWTYPDGTAWDPERNTREFVEAMPAWKQHGLIAFTLNLQGGSPEGYSADQPWRNSAFTPDGALDPAYLARLERILRRADDLGMVAILGLFYFGQDQQLKNEAAILRGVDGIVDWLFDGGFSNVLIEINNECDVQYNHPILQPARVKELITRIQNTKRNGRRFLVSTSFSGGTVPAADVVKASDFVLLHGNGLSDPRQAAELVRRTRALPGYKTKPVLFNEDDHTGFEASLNHFTAALAERAGWGFFDYRRAGEGPEHGFQSVPVNWTISSPRKQAFFDALANITGALPQGAIPGAHPGAPWWKGNLHTHTLWSDGDDYPEMIALWYRTNGYNFLALSDHNVLQEGQNWLTLTADRGGGKTLERYRETFGTWVEERSRLGTNQVRLKPLAEFRPLVEVPGQFLMIPSEELTDRHLTSPIHINFTNPRDRLDPQGGSNVTDVMQRNVNAVLAQRGRTGQPMFPHINHPNFGWGITAEDLMPLRGERFIEIYNGHPMVNNEGDTTHAGIEHVWDILLARRLGLLHLPIVFGLAVDDSHNYHAWKHSLSNPGRGWVMVRSPRLTPESLIEALESGDYYASSGVVLEDIQRTPKGLRLSIHGSADETFVTEFIGTRRGFDPSNEPYRNAAGEKLRVTHKYADSIGEVLARSNDRQPAYEFAGDELYVRARVTSSKRKIGGYSTNEFERAWVQPVIP